ncbi:MAG: dihydroorotate dehydrogenase electron transfer subunit [Chitinivibrionales bacterium]|nr:dihydroorotate dehydrogenase electron transfer subunit [Chitinivibrionales bacterium]
MSGRSRGHDYERGRVGDGASNSSRRCLRLPGSSTRSHRGIFYFKDMKQLQAKTISNVYITSDFKKLTFDWPQEAGIPRPGQFVTIRAAQASSPLLRRPFAFSQYDSQYHYASMIYQVRGPSTELIAGKSSGDMIDIVGALGNWFEPSGRGKRHMLIAGGVGLGPMLFYAYDLVANNYDYLLVFGCRESTQVPASVTFEDLEKKVICTDDGSDGFKGTTVDYLKTLPDEVIARSVLYACGPEPMLKACHHFALERGVDCYVSMEQTMACGVGACMGCTVKHASEHHYARVCTDGPIFNSREIVWT